MQYRAKHGKKRVINKKFIYIVAAAVLVVALVIGAVSIFTPKVTQKTINVVINDTENNIQTTYICKTKNKYLSQALFERGIIEGSQQESGFVIEKADGKKAEPTKYQLWVIHINGERGEQDASKIEIVDGDNVEIRLEYWQ